MRILAAALSLFLAAAPASAQQAAAPRAAAAQAIPVGQLPDTARPTAYRLDLKIDPAQERFSGHAEIDVDLRRRASQIFLHGRDLKVSKIDARVGGRIVPARWTQVNPLGVARVDFDRPLAPGRLTLRVDYDAPFSSTDDGLYRTKVGADHYAWTQFEAIEARSAFPAFDELRFKTPYTVTIATPAGSTAVTNGAHSGSTRAGGQTLHRFATTPAIPPSLVAFAVGPFDVLEGVIPPSSIRSKPVPQRIVATKGNMERMRYALAETPRIIHLLEDYFGIPYPYAKLDQIASPLMGGAMENVGAVIYNDSILLLPSDAPVRQRQNFGMVVAHELAHQWFGNLVTPAWWDDTWLKESFSNWLGYSIAAKWRPELNIAVGSIEEGLTAMNTDALVVGRPIRQPLADSGAIDGAFDVITYGKGGHVVEMVESYLGQDTFRKGVRLFLRRHAPSGTATADDFFKALAEAAGDPRLAGAMRSFVDRQGLPLITFTRDGNRLVATQTRYAALGAGPVPAAEWIVPLCARSGGQRRCVLLDKPSMAVDLTGAGPLIPNAGGHGYYRFDMPAADWDALIATGSALPAGEALAAVDSLWASFRAGRAGPERLVAAARSFARHSDSTVAMDSGTRLAGLESAGLIEAGALPAFRRLLQEVYAPHLQRIGFNPGRAAHAADPPEQLRLRGDLVALLAGAGRHEPTRAALATAATAYLGGNEAALDLAFLQPALRVHVQTQGMAAAEALLARAIASSDSTFRGAAIGALSSSGNVEIGQWLLAQTGREGLRSNEVMNIAGGLIGRPETRDLGFAWLRDNAVRLIDAQGAPSLSRLVGMPSSLCDAGRAAEAEATLRPLVLKHNRGALALDRTLERIRTCAALKQRRSAEVSAAVA
jgi:aminopeptidase N